VSLPLPATPAGLFAMGPLAPLRTEHIMLGPRAA
jgi:hypothetical protein